MFTSIGAGLRRPATRRLWLTIGAIAGSRYIPERALRYILAIVLFVAGAKLVLT